MDLDYEYWPEDLDFWDYVLYAGILVVLTTVTMSLLGD